MTCVNFGGKFEITKTLTMTEIVGPQRNVSVATDHHQSVLTEV